MRKIKWFSKEAKHNRHVKRVHKHMNKKGILEMSGEFGRKTVKDMKRAFMWKMLTWITFLVIFVMTIGYAYGSLMRWLF